PPPSPSIQHENRVSVFFVVGMIWRGAVDPMAGVGLRAGRSAGLGGTVRLAVAPWSSPHISGEDVDALVGMAYRSQLAPRVAIDLGLEAGVAVHAFRVTDPGATAANGVRLAPLVEVPLALSFLFDMGAQLQVRAAGGIAAAAFSDTEAGQV